MKRTLLILAVGALLTCPIFAQDDSTNAPPSGPPPGGHHGFLTKADWQELKSAHDAALQANPDLVAQEKALRQQQEAYHKALNTAMITADPKVAPILTKLESAHKHHGGPGGPGGPPPDDDNGQ